jgi:VWFA-related protein
VRRLLTLLVPAIVSSTVTLFVQSPQQPTFRAAVDLIAVEAQVADAEGRPMTALTRDHFEVTIDGRRRRVASATLLQTSDRADPSASASIERTFVLAIDAASFEPGQTLPVIQAARAFVDEAGPRDAVGVFTLVRGGPRVAPTTDRAAVRRTLGQVLGLRPSISGQFNLTASEIVDIMAETSGMVLPARTLPGNTVTTPGPVFSDGYTLQRVQLRECRSTTDPGCVSAIMNEASALGSQMQERISQSLTNVGALLGLLRELPGRKTVVVLSGGMAVSDRPGGMVDIGREASSLGEQAAHANATIYAIHIDAGMRQTYSSQARRVRDPAALDRERHTAGRLLDEFAGASGGTLLTALVDQGDIALARVLSETSAYYLLGVEPDNLDRDGRTHKLRVKVTQRGATIRSRQWVVLRKPS